MSYLTSGNQIVDAMGQINISGNVVPTIWHKTITRDNGKPYLLAIVILADIVYWYRPTEVRDHSTGHIAGWRKKFSGDILRQSYQYYAELFGESKKTIKTAMDRLEQLGVIKKEFRTITYGEGMTLNNVMFVELIPEGLYQLTYPEEIPNEIRERASILEGTAETMGGGLSTKAEPPMEKSGETLWKNQVPPPSENFHRGYREFPQVWKNSEGGHAENFQSLVSKISIGVEKFGGTYSENTTKSSTENNYLINQSGYSTTMPQNGLIDESDAYMSLIRENVEYEIYMSKMERNDREMFDELYQIICEVVCIPQDEFIISGRKYPYNLVKSRFLKLTGSHLEYVIECMKNTTTNISNIRSYMITALYNAPATINHYYQQQVNYEMSR